MENKMEASISVQDLGLGFGFLGFRASVLRHRA